MRYQIRTTPKLHTYTIRLGFDDRTLMARAHPHPLFDICAVERVDHVQFHFLLIRSWVSLDS